MGEEHRGEPTDEPQANQRLTVAQVAGALGITEGAVRSRTKRGILPTIKEGGTVYVVRGGTSATYQPPNTGKPYGVPSGQPELVETLREQVAYLQGVIATRDRELAQRGEEIHRQDQALELEQELAAMFADRLRQLEAPRDEQNAPESTGSRSDKITPSEAAEEQERSALQPWWRRWLGVGGA